MAVGLDTKLSPTSDGRDPMRVGFFSCDFIIATHLTTKFWIDLSLFSCSCYFINDLLFTVRSHSIYTALSDLYVFPTVHAAPIGTFSGARIFSVWLLLNIMEYMCNHGQWTLCTRFFSFSVHRFYFSKRFLSLDLRKPKFYSLRVTHHWIGLSDGGLSRVTDVIF